MMSPSFLPVPCNHSWTGFKLGRKNATHLRHMSWGPPHNVVHWGHPFETPRYNEVTLWWRGCVEPGHHLISLVLVGAMCREVFWEITEIQNEKEPQHNLCAAPNFHLGGGSYCDSASPVHCIKFLPCMVFRPFRVCKSCNPAHFGCRRRMLKGHSRKIGRASCAL